MIPPAKHLRQSGKALVAAGLLTLLAALAVVVTAMPGHAQFWRRDNSGWNRGRIPDPPPRSVFPGDTFTFCTVVYTSVRHEALGFGWDTDYPYAGRHFMTRLEELTTIKIERERNGDPHQVVMKLTDDALVNYPYIFMSDVGTAEFNQAEIEALRSYLLRGGFLHVDDFWGQRAWDYWEYEIDKVLPSDEYPIEDVPLSDEIFHIVFDVLEVPQVPSIQHWERVNGATTSERGADSAVPHMRGIRDHNGHWMVIMTHNTDIADGWEKETADPEYFQEFSVKKSYPLGINIVVYAMTH